MCRRGGRPGGSGRRRRWPRPSRSSSRWGAGRGARPATAISAPAAATAATVSPNTRRRLVVVACTSEVEMARNRKPSSRAPQLGGQHPEVGGLVVDRLHGDDPPHEGVGLLTRHVGQRRKGFGIVAEAGGIATTGPSPVRSTITSAIDRRSPAWRSGKGPPPPPGRPPSPPPNGRSRGVEEALVEPVDHRRPARRRPPRPPRTPVATTTSTTTASVRRALMLIGHPSAVTGQSSENGWHSRRREPCGSAWTHPGRPCGAGS